MSSVLQRVLFCCFKQDVPKINTHLLVRRFKIEALHYDKTLLPSSLVARQSTSNYFSAIKCTRYSTIAKKLTSGHGSQRHKSSSGSKNSESSQSFTKLGSFNSTLAANQLSSLSSLKSITSLGSRMGLTKMRVIPIKALSDNYMYLLIDEATNKAACIDPVNPSAIASHVHDNSVDLQFCLTTHHHHDHAGGNAELKNLYPEIEIYGGDARIMSISKLVSHGEIIKLGQLTIECLSTPCHTRAHICYYVTSPPDDTSSANRNEPTTEKVVFTGDTLFVGGCGRFFEGTPEQMDHALNAVLGNLPPETLVFCGHEYTVTNLKFALSVEPHNMDIKSKLSWAQNKVSKKEPTIPSTIADEKKINPFMRIRKTSVRKFTGESEDIEVMASLRQAKNEFQP